MVSAFTSTEFLKWQKCDVIETTNQKCGLIIGAEKQEFWGFGGCFNEQGKAALDKLNDKERIELLDNIFTNDFQFDFCRLPVAANDYALDWYSYNETDGDFKMKNFSIERDKKTLIPYVKEALKRNPKIKFFASPWSPPTWMKRPKVYNWGRIDLSPQNLDAYALYFVKYIQAYEKEGIHISQLHFQNEPYADTKYPSCLWNYKEIGTFIHGHLAPAFKKHGIDSEIWLGTLNGTVFEGVHQLCYTDFEQMAFPLIIDDVEHNIKGIAYQWYGKHTIAQTAESFPNLPIIQSENECGDGTNTWEYMKYIFGLVHHYLKCGVRAYCYWNMILPTKNGISTWGMKQNCLVSIDRSENPNRREVESTQINKSTGEEIVTYNNEYFLLKHLSKFIGAGSTFLDASGDFASMSVSFKNAQGQIITIIKNPLETDREIVIASNNKQHKLTLKADSITTVFSW